MREILAAVEQRTGAIRGSEIGLEVSPKITQGRREKHTILPSSEGKPARSQLEIGRSAEQVEKRSHLLWHWTGIRASRPSHYRHARNNGETDSTCRPRAEAEARCGGNRR
jgi:hypothetical protein